MNRGDSEHHQSLPLSNDEVAACLEEIAELLEEQAANPFRVRAYRTAAETVRTLPTPLDELLEDEGTPGLTKLQGIGASLARSIEQLTHTGKLALLSRLRGDAGPERVLATVPGLGPELAARIHDELGIESLAELQAAAIDGRLAQVPGLGPRRVQAVRESLAGRFRQRPAVRQSRQTESPADEPPVAELLEIDADYRRKAEADRLPRIAPRRFNPTGTAWLPVLHTHQADRHYTALYSNTARAHELGTTHDWVVIYRDDRDGHGQWTVVTSQFGPLKGRRIVRGREQECAAHYAENPPPDPAEAQHDGAFTHGAQA